MTSNPGKAPIVIVGAGRSGTKLLRGILVSHPDTVCFPREINYIWRYGNAGYPTDELLLEHARPTVVRYIRNRIASLSLRNGGARVVEKTCANSLRVDFCHRVVPDAFFIHLVRDGRAVAESARRRWQAGPELGYLLEKARWVPPSDVPYYALRYLRHQVGRLRSAERAQSSWGPRFTGLDSLVENLTLIEVCGLQWRACVQAADAALRRLPSSQCITVRYEDLVADPMPVVRELLDRAGLAFVAECGTYVHSQVQGGNLSKWRERLSQEELRLLLPHISSELGVHGYEI